MTKENNGWISMATIAFTRDNEYIPKYKKDTLEIELSPNGTFEIVIDEPIHGMTDSGMITTWVLSTQEAKELAKFLINNIKE